MCDFPAKELIIAARRLILFADRSKERPVEYLEVHLAATRARIEHEQLTGCKCWYQALEEIERG